MTPRKVYIAGKVSGLKPEDVWYKFEEICSRINGRNEFAINPLKLDGASTMEEYLIAEIKPWEHYLKLGITALMKCDAIYMLKDWKESKGSQIEHMMATVLGLEIIYENRQSEVNLAEEKNNALAALIMYNVVGMTYTECMDVIDAVVKHIGKTAKF